MTTKPSKARKKPVKHSEGSKYPFYPDHILRVLMTVMGAVALVALISSLFPLPLEHIADPLTEPDAGIRALWILKPVVLLKDILSIPGLTAVVVALLATLFALLPILDRSGRRSIKRRIVVAVPFLLWMLFLALSQFLTMGVN